MTRNRFEEARHGMTVHYLDWNAVAPSACRHGALAIGNFDGVHRGHVALVQELRRQAVAAAGPAVAMTFDPHPLQVLRPEQFQPPLTTVADRAGLLRANGADEVIVLRTTAELLRLSAAAFFEDVIRCQMSARAVVEGVNFRFGRGRKGNVETMRRLGEPADIIVVVVPPLATGDGVAVSSSRVRRALLNGAVAEAAELMGHDYRLRGVVGKGQQRGAGIGFPTANLEQAATLVPGDGVYAVHVMHEGYRWPGAANVGPNPTFGEQARKLEVHLIGFRGDLYGRELAVDFVERLRDTRAYGSVEELVRQLRLDVSEAERKAGKREAV